MVSKLNQISKLRHKISPILSFPATVAVNTAQSLEKQAWYYMSCLIRAYFTISTYLWSKVQRMWRGQVSANFSCRVLTDYHLVFYYREERKYLPDYRQVVNFSQRLWQCRNSLESLHWKNFKYVWVTSLLTLFYTTYVLAHVSNHQRSSDGIPLRHDSEKSLAPQICAF